MISLRFDGSPSTPSWSPPAGSSISMRFPHVVANDEGAPAGTINNCVTLNGPGGSFQLFGVVEIDIPPGSNGRAGFSSVDVSVPDAPGDYDVVCSLNVTDNGADDTWGGTLHVQ